MKRLLYSICCLFCVCLLARPVSAQIGMGGQPHSSAVLDLKSPANNKAFYPPRLTTAQRKAIVAPQAGAFVYDTDHSTMFLFDGVYWLPLALQSSTAIMPVTRLASDGTASDFFGEVVAISGNYALVGAPAYSTKPGAAYIFVRTGNSWVELQKLSPADGGTAGGRFGASVAIAGDYAVVGSSPVSGQGAVYIYKRSGTAWTQQQRLTANDGGTNDRFGESVAITDGFVLVGAADRFNGSGLGAAYVFSLSGATAVWTQQQRLTASDAAVGDGFGASVGISGTNAIVGAPFKTIDGISFRGAAYMYQYQFAVSGSTWRQRQRLTENITFSPTGGKYGRSVAISGNYAIVGQPDFSGYGTHRGAAYTYIGVSAINTPNITWTRQAYLTPDDDADGDRFGWSVSIAGDYALIGASFKTVGNNSGQGAAYLFKRAGSSWSQFRTITDNSPSDTYLGWSVGLSTEAYILGGYGFQNQLGKVAFGGVDN